MGASNGPARAAEVGSLRPAFAVLVALLLVAAAVRLPGVFSRSIWYDEAVTLVIASGRTGWTWPSEPSPAGVHKAVFVPPRRELGVAPVEIECCHPALYFQALTVWRGLFGEALEAARLMSFAASLAAVALLFRLACLAGARRPWIPALFGGLATAAVHAGHEARPYALAELLVVLAALAAWRPATATGPPSATDVRDGLAAAVAGALAVLTLHLAVFPVGALLLWLAARTWARSRTLALAVPAVAAAIAGLGLPVVLAQAGVAVSHRGETTLGAELATALRHSARGFGFGVPRGFASGGGALALFADLAFLAVAAVAAVGLLRRARADRRLVELAILLALAPSAGVAVLDLGFGWHLTEPRFHGLAAVGLALAIGTGLSELTPRPRWAGWLVVLVVAVQLSRVNWGFETCADDLTGSITRSMARLAAATGDETLVAIGAGHGLGDPASWTYELPPAATMLVFSRVDATEEVAARCARFPSVWVALASDRITRPQEERLMRSLLADGYQVAFASPKAVHLVRPFASAR